MRCSTTPHPWYCGIALHARPMDVCRVSQDGEVVWHRTMPAAPAPWLTARAPSRDGLVVAVECLFTWDGLAELGAPAGLPLGRGPAVSRQARHGGKAKNDPIDSQTIAVWLRGGMLPPAYGYPADRRAPRALRWRRLSLTRKRAARLGPVPQTPSQSHWPHMGKTLADTATRTGVVERFSAPAVHTSVAVAVALLGADDARLRDLAWPRVPAAKQPASQPLSRRPRVPGSGPLLRRVLFYARPASARVPRGHAGVSYGRLVQGATASAGPRYGTSGPKSGPASLQGACSEAAGLLLRAHPAGQTSLARLAHTQGKGQALPLLAPQRARAVSHRLPRGVGVAGAPWRRRSGRGGGKPVAARGHPGWRLGPRAPSC
jgi:hypothetical protein